MKKRKPIRTACAILSALLAFSLTGCSKPDNVQKFGVTEFENVNELDNHGYYVLHENKYYKPYFGYTTFSQDKEISKESVGRIAWFGEDYENIPTIYKGDTIVYRSSSPFTESLTIERFEDLGYTIGICQVKESSTGRITFKTDSGRLNVNVNSDAGVICQHGDTIATLEKIGGVSLRAGNISRAGTIIGLSKDKTYNCDVYIGTELYEYKIKADVKALCSMEVFSIKDYTFDRSKIIKFELPNNLQSGYYNIGGYGIVRYINSTNKEFSESMDMNIPNDVDNMYINNEDTSFTEEFEDYREDVKEEIFTLNEDTDVTVSVIYQDVKDYEDAPTVKVVGTNSAHTLNPGEKANELTATLSLKSGTYTIKLIGLGSRTYSYRVTQNKKEETENTQESTSEETQDTNKKPLSIADQLKEEEAKKNGR